MSNTAALENSVPGAHDETQLKNKLGNVSLLWKKTFNKKKKNKRN